MNEDEILEMLVISGVLSGGAQRITVHDKPVSEKRVHKKKAPEGSIDQLLSAYHRNEISDAVLCEQLGVEEEDLYECLVAYGRVFW